jgi:redox-sensitive bicupin YhaK (pirin superfamily)
MSKLAQTEVFKLARGPWRTFDPFLFCVYHRDEFPAALPGTLGPDPKLLRDRNIGSDFSYEGGWSMYHGDSVPGFPVHPHRGFETVTAMLEGVVDHSDSLGAAGRYGSGDTQWMTAGAGVQHCEMFPLLHSDKPNTMEMFQLWLNLPKKSKMVPADFKMLWDAQTPTVTQPSGATIRVIAGAIAGAPQPPSPTPNSWAADPANDVAIWVVRVPAGATADIPAAQSGRTNRTVYMWGGNGTAVVSRAADDAGAAGENVKLSYYTGVKVDAAAALSVAAEGGEVKLLVLQGAPIGEPVAQYGPFVMNTQQEIMQAFSDFRRTNFGEWKWGRSDHTHGPTAGRFALYPDGRRDTPPAAVPAAAAADVAAAGSDVVRK